MFFLRMQTCNDAFIFRICATFSFLDGVLVGSTPFERTDNEIKILNESMTTPLSVVARDGIEPPTQAFSGLVLLEPGYVAQVTCNAKTHKQPVFFQGIESYTGIQIKNLV